MMLSLSLWDIFLCFILSGLSISSDISTSFRSSPLFTMFYRSFCFLLDNSWSSAEEGSSYNISYLSFNLDLSLISTFSSISYYTVVSGKLSSNVIFIREILGSVVNLSDSSFWILLVNLSFKFGYKLLSIPNKPFKNESN